MSDSSQLIELAIERECRAREHAVVFIEEYRAAKAFREAVTAAHGQSAS
jgi:hypothetical protein